MNKSEIGLEEYNSYYQPYIDKAGTGNVFDDLRSNHETIILFLKSIPVEKLHYRYAKGKWTIKEILLHLIDTERVFAYRQCVLQEVTKPNCPVLIKMILLPTVTLIKEAWKASCLNTKVLERLQYPCLKALIKKVWHE